jgi:hypothetical protein
VLLKICKKTGAAIIVCLLVMTSVSQAFAAERRFPDMTGHWAEKYVNILADEGIISGMSDGNFHPDEEVNSGQFVTMLIRGCFGEIAPVSGHWASGYLEKAKQLDVIYDADVDDVDIPLARRFAARISHEALVTILGEPDESDVSKAEVLIDLNDCRTCTQYVEQVYTKGIMTGYPDSMFYGSGTLTRAEAAAVVAKILNKSLR